MKTPINSDSIGKVIVEDITSKSGTLLMKSGLELTKSLIERLQKNNITEVDVGEISVLANEVPVKNEDQNGKLGGETPLRVQF